MVVSSSNWEVRMSIMVEDFDTPEGWGWSSEFDPFEGEDYFDQDAADEWERMEEDAFMEAYYESRWE